MAHRTRALFRGAVVGATLMYLLDPVQGRKRRALLLERAENLRNDLGASLERTYRDLRDLGARTVASARCLLSGGAVPDEVLVPRVRSRMRHLVSHPESIDVSSVNGLVSLSGPVLYHELEPLISTVKSISGVRDLDNHLEVHERPGSVPGLQGSSVARAAAAWPGTTTLLAGAAGAGLVYYAARRRSPFWLGLAAAAAGVAMQSLNQDRAYGIAAVRPERRGRSSARDGSPREEAVSMARTESPEPSPARRSL